MAAVFVRIYGELNDFLPRAWRHETLVYPLRSPGSAKDMIEALGVPHTEIDLIVVNNVPVTFGYGVTDGDRVAVYPRFRALALEGVTRLAPPSSIDARFVADVHLGRLAAYLRIAGFDTVYRNDFEDKEIISIAARENRTVLTRDVAILKHNAVERGYFLRNIQPARQLVEVLQQFGLAGCAAPFTRCVHCNSALHDVAKEDIVHMLPPRTREHYLDFAKCQGCERIYWQGSHYTRMQEFLDRAFAIATKGDYALAPELNNQPDIGSEMVNPAEADGGR